MIIFLHLSDIHFHKWSGSTYDVDGDVRNELELDAEALAKEVGRPDGILITGDIAFSGQQMEFEKAKTWLRTLCAKVNCTLAEVWCVPGNHDVDQGFAKESTTLADIHQKLRDVATSYPSQLDGEILKRMGDPFAREPLFRPIVAYNVFAATFGCAIDPSNPRWEQRFQFDDGSTLRLNGLNSTIVSNHLDNHHRFVVLGQHQVPQQSPGIVDFVMCHHPHDWLRGDDAVKRALNKRVPVQLFGHKHVQAIDRHNDSLHLIAGAVHPDRREPSWQPRYNWLTTEIHIRDGTRQLAVTVYPRILSDNRSFAPDFNSCEGQNHKVYKFELSDWTPPAGPPAAVTATTSNAPRSAIGAAMNRSRILTYRFFDLSHIERIDIARELDLLRDEDEGVNDAELYKRIFRRAADSKVFEELWTKVEQRHPDMAKAK